MALWKSMKAKQSSDLYQQKRTRTRCRSLFFVNHHVSSPRLTSSSDTKSRVGHIFTPGHVHLCHPNCVLELCVLKFCTAQGPVGASGRPVAALTQPPLVYFQNSPFPTEFLLLHLQAAGRCITGRWGCFARTRRSAPPTCGSTSPRPSSCRSSSCVTATPSSSGLSGSPPR